MSRMTLVKRAASRPTWDEGFHKRISRIAHHPWWDRRANDEEYDFILDLREIADEYERIDKSPPLPTTAQLMRNLPPRNIREKNLAGKIRGRIRERQAQLLQGKKLYKTYDARKRQERRIFEADARLTRLGEVAKMFRKYTGRHVHDTY
jgi:hypothetical protein